ncbi:hypothetical protein [Siphonobacter sp. SORGH_AS_0500]|uniref:hypothetical protein n=1 Tax=Siphonobacter sp. SORGH_AS_0500 TaxID=1864824 RepID=UPI00285AF004|nr:hypothetical protein [Siphonobacter sp. SORGH_AS_0500]MDR6193103.1 hypothetical protein [Siphonobacter sp. SORGH_AS_0500]
MIRFPRQQPNLKFVSGLPFSSIQIPSVTDDSASAAPPIPLPFTKASPKATALKKEITPIIRQALKVTMPLLPCLLGSPGFFLAGLMVGYTLSSENQDEAFHR